MGLTSCIMKLTVVQHATRKFVFPCHLTMAIRNVCQRLYPNPNALVAFSALTLLVGRQEEIQLVKRMGGWWRWALVSPDGVALSRIVCVSASVNLPLHHKV